MTDYATYASYTCYNGSMFGYYVAYLGLSLYLTVWCGISAMGYYDKQLVILLLNISIIPQHLLFFLLQNTIQEERLCNPRGNPGEIIYGNPSSESGLVFSFITFVISFNYLRNSSMKANYLFKLGLLTVFIIWAPWWSGNHSFMHLFNGAITGIFIGLTISIAIHYYWLEDFKTILQSKLMKKLGYYDTLCIKDEDTIEETSTVKRNMNTNKDFCETKPTLIQNFLLIETLKKSDNSQECNNDKFNTNESLVVV